MLIFLSRSLTPRTGAGTSFSSEITSLSARGARVSPHTRRPLVVASHPRDASRRHCKSLAPNYAAASTQLAGDNIQLVAVDATVHTALASQYDVSGYPTLKVFQAGSTEPSDYNGGRDTASIVKYMRSQNGPAAAPLKASEVADFVNKVETDTTIVGYFTKADSDAAKTFAKAAAAKRENFRFGIVTDAAEEKVVNHRPKSWRGEKPEIVFDGTLTDQKALVAFFASSSIPLGGLFNQERYATSSLPRVHVFANVDEVNDPAGTRYFVNRARKAATKFEGALHFVVEDKRSSSTYNEFGFADDAKFGVGVVDPRKGKYRRDSVDGETFSVDVLTAFAEKYLAGDVELHVKSEDVPSDPYVDGKVKTLVGKTIGAELASGKNVFIEFYAPWCGHCKSLAPKWEELAEKVSDDSNLVVAKLDATANDVPPAFEVRGFPTLFLQKGDGSVVKYEGAREVKDFTKWLKKQGVYSPGKAEL